MNEKVPKILQNSFISEETSKILQPNRLKGKSEEQTCIQAVGNETMKSLNFAGQ